MTESEADTTGVDVPAGPGYRLDALPELAGQGWLDARRVPDNDNEMMAIIYEDAGIEFQMGLDDGRRYQLVRGETPLDKLPRDDPRSLQQRGETTADGHGETFEAGDWLVDWRWSGREWTGRRWRGERCELRVRVDTESGEED